MEKFLREARENLVHIEKYDSVCIVLGNESCDLDSAVCALVFANFLKHQDKHSTSIYIPLLNICKDDFVLKTEVIYFLRRFNISSEQLIFRDEVCLNSLISKGKLKLVLVDHNILPNSDSHLDASVVEIVDHHKQEHASSKEIKMLIETVGSCATLIGSLVLESAPEILDIVSASLLLGAILIDVANFSLAAKRATAKDEQVFNQLTKLTPNISKDALYNEIQSAKENVSHLRLEQLFRKDAKAIAFGGISLVVCSFPLLCSTLLSKYLDIEEKLQGFCSVFNYHAVVLMGISINHETDTVTRDIIVYSQLAWLKNRLCRGLEKTEPNLDLHIIKSETDYIYYNQGNIKATRKIILPILKNLLAKPESSNSAFSHRVERSNILSTSVLDGNPEDSSPVSNSGIDTPTNSCVDEEEVRRSSVSTEFPSAGDVFANMESQKYLLFRRRSDGLQVGGSNPLTPENSYAESHFDQSYKKFVLNQMDSDAIEKKLRQENFFRESDD